MGEPDTTMEPGTLCFRCNVCGTTNLVAMEKLGREVASCTHCGSSGRWRSIVSVLSVELFGTSMALPEFPSRPDLVGLGMTDWDGYAVPLASLFTFRNTFFHQEPRLDICAADIPDSLKGNDFIISSEVLEHVPPPVGRAFSNILDMLKPGGCLILTVPYGLDPGTREHFPELYEYNVVEHDGTYTLQNRTRSGEIQEFGDLCFHGGPGATLEMRVFSETGLLADLNAAGFDSIKIHRPLDFRHGVWWPEAWSLPISARRPVA